MSTEQTPRNDTGNDGLTASGRSRRNFLIAGAAAGGGLIIGLALPKVLDRRNPQPEDARTNGVTANSREAEQVFAPNAFIRIDREGLVTLIMPKAEMGQGTYTSIPMLIASICTSGPTI